MSKSTADTDGQTLHSHQQMHEWVSEQPGPFVSIAQAKNHWKCDSQTLVQCLTTLVADGELKVDTVHDTVVWWPASRSSAEN